jgi:hypothetical protein
MKYRVFAKCESEVAFIIEAENPTVAAMIANEEIEEDDGATLETEIVDQGTTTLTGEVIPA